MEEFTEGKLISEFNEAKFQVYRIGLCWEKSNTSREKRDYLNWAIQLDLVWDELIAKCIRRNDTHYISFIKRLDKQISNCGKDKKSLVHFLRIKHQALKVIQDVVGLGGKMKDSDEDNMDE